MTDEGARLLIDEIVKRAANDYRVGRKGLRKKNISTEMRYYYMRLVAEAETFFTSDWFYAMGGSPDMWMQLKRECSQGRYRLTTSQWRNKL